MAQLHLRYLHGIHIKILSDLLSRIIVKASTKCALADTYGLIVKLLNRFGLLFTGFWRREPPNDANEILFGSPLR